RGAAQIGTCLCRALSPTAPTGATPQGRQEMMPRLLLVFTVVLLLNSCGTEKTDVMFECASPSGAKVASFYRVATGERPGDQTMKLNIRPAGAAFNAAMSSFSFRHGYDAILHWQSDSALRVEYPQGSEITGQELVVFGSSQTFSASDTIQITYTERPSTHGHFMVEKRCLPIISD
ncbi:MAG: hypothetical protein Q9M30_10365, partial [Mariprofundaceae bacterium]|nr:hypothetical protein [Mariprofundaceae bacterium]